MKALIRLAKAIFFFWPLLAGIMLAIWLMGREGLPILVIAGGIAVNIVWLYFVSDLAVG